MFVVVTVVAMLAGFLAMERRRVLVRRAIAAEARDKGWRVGGAGSGEPIVGRGDFMNWLAEALGDEALMPYVVYPEGVSDEEIQEVRKAFPEAPMWIER